MSNPIHRRRLLRGAGVAVALPMLEAMTPSRVTASQWPALDVEAPKRMVAICTTLGLHGPSLWPSTGGRDYEQTSYLGLLREHRSDFTLFSKLRHEDQIGRQPHDSETTFLSSARRPGMSGFRNSVSVDQYVASRLRGKTRFPSVTLSTLKPASQSFTSSGVMIPAQTSPKSLFGSLFLRGSDQEIATEKLRLSTGHSILDQLGDEAQLLKSRASAGDGRLLDEYFESIREAERDISQRQSWLESPRPKTDVDEPFDVNDPADLIGKTRLLMKMIPLILQSDSSRVVTLMIQDHFAVPKVDGVAGSHHSLSHHGQSPVKIEQLRRVESQLIECFGDLLTGLKGSGEQAGSLLDETSVLFGSNLGNANAHDTRNLPIFLAGGGFDHGSFVDRQADTPLCNLFVAMMQNMGLEVDQFGQSSGRLTW